MKTTNLQKELENRIQFYLSYISHDKENKSLILEILKELRQELRLIKLKKITKPDEKEIPSDDGN